MAGLKIMQCLRAPVGGLFRHVCDLTDILNDAGHEVGIVCDAGSGGAAAEQALEAIGQKCRLGLHRLPMGRMPGIADYAATRSVARIARDWGVDIMHGHGAKGGAYVRLAKTTPTIAPKRFYTPHGGSLHYSPKSPIGRVFLFLERYLMFRTEGIIFESEYAFNVFESKVGKLSCPARVIHNGVRDHEFDPVILLDNPDDFVFVGELRQLKGVTTLLQAIRILHDADNMVTATLVGAGPDREKFVQMAKDIGIDHAVTFPGPLPARVAFGHGRVLVVPSLHESLPYIILEAGAAAKPVIATNVGGIPEIFGPLKDHLIEPDDPVGLAAQMKHYSDALNSDDTMEQQLQNRLRQKFTARHMGEQILGYYNQT